MREQDQDHYSNKGGHLFRGVFWKTLRSIERRNPDICACRAIVSQTVETSWLIKRDMLRTPKDGKR
ncbi:MAG: hypothetical protein Q7R43_01475 [Candidatus Daviesbacteria bacterium]|nr:hypothetical protein [Candidatus Daviesbacteria bacterium]